METSAPIDGNVATKTNTYKNITGSEMGYRVATTNEAGQAQLDEEGNGGLPFVAGHQQ